jgi:hypothetical protein
MSINKFYLFLAKKFIVLIILDTPIQSLCFPKGWRLQGNPMTQASRRPPVHDFFDGV